MERVNVLIIGAGVVGLAIAKTLSQKYSNVVIVDKENSFGRHTSSRNSEVMHSGIYYPHGSLKAELCVRGNDLLTCYARENGIPHRVCGKFVVATSEEDVPNLLALHQNGQGNNVQDLCIIEKNRMQELEPQIKAIMGLHVPSTGIIDTHALMKNMEKMVEHYGAFVVYGMDVTGIKKKSDGYLVEFANGDQWHSRILINSAGLFSEAVSRMAGIETESNGLKVYWCKGEYYKTDKVKGIRHLVYPVPDPLGIHLGIHLTINLAGAVRFGPNAYYVDTLDYSMDDRYHNDIFNAVNKYIDVPMDYLHPDDTGIRSKLQGPNQTFRDFYIREESNKGLPNFINLAGIESPGLTSCLAIGEYVANLVAKNV